MTAIIVLVTVVVQTVITPMKVVTIGIQETRAVILITAAATTTVRISIRTATIRTSAGIADIEISTQLRMKIQPQTLLRI